MKYFETLPLVLFSFMLITSIRERLTEENMVSLSSGSSKDSFYYVRIVLVNDMMTGSKKWKEEREVLQLMRGEYWGSLQVFRRPPPSSCGCPCCPRPTNITTTFLSSHIILTTIDSFLRVNTVKSYSHKILPKILNFLW